MDENALQEDSKLILNAYRTLLRACKANVDQNSKKLIRKAFQYSMDAHRGMRRKSGEPYIIHPLEVATICAREIGLGTKSIVAALLHDVVEDTEIGLDEIEELFGPKIASIIDGLTKVSGFVGKSNSSQAENFKKILLTLADDVRVILVKLADRLHNMRTLGSLPSGKRLKIASETLYLYAPLAHRLGLYAIKSELEDLSLKYTEPEIYDEISEKLQSSKSQRSRLIRKFIKPIEKRLADINAPFTIKGRLKSVYSIYNKMKRQGIPFEKVFDIFAIRIIVHAEGKQEKEECWRVYSIVTDIYRPNPQRLRDWISNPKFNGYESLHTTVMGPNGRWMEVQIRSERMDEIAEKGFAAHWKYKEGKVDSDHGLDDWLAHIREVLDSPEKDSLDFLDDFKLNLFSDEIFAFTPKGDLKNLPIGASALDFAFEIHSDVGIRCLGAKVNHKLVPLSYKIKNGDQIEILTSKKQKPSEGWLDIVVTAKAKSKIKAALKDEKRKVAIEGKEYLKLKLEKNKLGFENYTLDKLMNHFKLSSTIELYYLIGNGKIDKTDITKALKVIQPKEEKTTSKKPDAKKSKKQNKHEQAKDNKSVLIIGDSDIDMDYQFAQCCNPIPGDAIFGFLTVSDGIKIHRTNCPNGIALMSRYGYRIIEARWSTPEISETKHFAAGIKILGIDSPGIISQVSTIISNELKVNMKSITFQAVHGAYEGSIILELIDTRHLIKIMEKLQNIEGVDLVSRFSVEETLG